MPFGIDFEYLSTIKPTTILTHWFTPASQYKIDHIFDYGVSLEFFKDGNEVSEMKFERMSTYISDDAFRIPYHEFSYNVPIDMQDFDSIR